LFLEKIELDGFKSFAHSVEVEFDAPLTAIVGPNGSGKSNIVDAVRWVLGEQSARELRGSRMSDVIFAGSDGHRARSEASVTLYINNEEGNLPLDSKKVTIGRQVNSEGQSSYYLNDSHCRLKDIEQLLMDTGLGKRSYSIVGQGQITSIINSRPERLRELFEESAGISRHRERKEETEKRLEKNSSDLQRIEDIVSELQNQLPGLKKEANKAKEYRRLKERLQKIEINLLQNKWDYIKENLEEQKAKKHKLTEKRQDYSTKFSSLNDRLNNQKELLSEIENELNEKKEVHYRFKAKAEEAHNKLEINRERLNSLEREQKEKEKLQQRLEQKIQNYKQRKKNLQEKKESLQQKKNQKLRKLNDLDKKIESKKEEMENHRARIEKKQSEFINDEQRNRLRSARDRTEENIEHVRSRLREILSECRDSLREARAVLKQKKELIEIGVQKESKLQELKKCQQQNKKQLKKTEKKVKKINDRFEEIKSRYNESQSRLEFLQKRENNYQGYYQGVKAILGSRKKFPGLIDPVADIITVDKKFEDAAASALGSRLQNIVVKQDDTAQKAINYLKETDSGQATFLPLNMINGQRINPRELNLKNQDGFIGIGARLVSAPEKFTPLLDYLLGRVLFARDLASASRIAKKIDTRYKIVSLAGEIINPGGAMTGGSSKNRNQQFLERKREIDKLSDLTEQLACEGQEVKDRLEKAEKMKRELINKIDKTEQQLQDLSIEKNSFLKDLEGSLRELKRSSSFLTRKRENFYSLLKKMQKLRQEKKDIVVKLDTAAEDQAREKEAVKGLKEKISSLEQNLEKLQEQRASIRVQKATIEQKIEDISENIEQMRQEIENTQDRINTICERFSRIKNQRHELKQEKQKLQQQIDEFSGRVEELAGEIEKSEDEVAHRKEQVESLEKKVKPAYSRLEECREQIHELDLKINQLQNDQKRINEKLAAEYDYDPETDSPPERVELENEKKAEQKINELRSKIKKLQPVNESAVKEYEELKERVDYLIEQKEDLLGARESLEKIISEIESTMGQLFYETFLEIKEEFEEIFTRLFNGGKAELKLTDEQDYLNTGVEISARPPGKDLKRLSLLSGGERALTAIALVFAFLNVNPSPLYILDEIDAPLDDVNLAKFTDFIEQYSKIAQFIIITHRKHMMSRVETLYGVTMEESGISRLISLKFDEEGVEFAQN